MIEGKIHCITNQKKGCYYILKLLFLFLTKARCREIDVMFM